ncbi:hypothetical protein VII00023_08679 [Vibrio ichthyoenteri ATCC 700023]|uniref:Acyl-coenzyme A thioesterase THEM4 n=1 Tax=Vibrio ichthyoenteri ATCC 700023 TaxID=870968 RepID=F9S7Q4_9VIBR|nr:PaaI family thioesterase [Vibrio ichthyoenteri]EGU31072.1 hypothetical protein VII00023_08679 [Vibrio ichthyoenteri ATCC 700023]
MFVSKPLAHQQCVVCGSAFFSDQCLEYQALSADSVQATIVATQKVQGYVGVMQGGLISALHDSAMLHCLFHLGVTAMTAALTVRFHQPVPIGQSICITARVVKKRRHIYWLESNVCCDGVICSSASSQFMPMNSNENR